MSEGSVGERNTPRVFMGVFFLMKIKGEHFLPFYPCIPSTPLLDLFLCSENMPTAHPMIVTLLGLTDTPGSRRPKTYSEVARQVRGQTAAKLTDT